MHHTATLPLFRVANQDDIAAITDLVSAGPVGMTTLPRGEAEVAEQINRTELTLKGDTKANRILFVVEREGEILGISSIIPHLGMERPFYSFKHSRHSRRSTNPEMTVRHETLQLTTDFDGCTELATLYLSPDARGGGLGRLLSYGRLAFIARHQDMFEGKLMADIRGWMNEDGESPFWRHFASRFIDLSFDEADRLSVRDGRFIVELLPSISVLLNLLPDDARNAVGRPHDNARGAYSMLMAAGFEATDLCDVFDGGPAISCSTRATAVSRTMKRATRTTAPDQAISIMHCTGQQARFKAVVATGDVSTAATSQSAIDALCVSAPEDIWIAEMAHSSSHNSD